MSPDDLADWFDELIWNIRHPERTAKLYVSAGAMLALLAAQWFGSPAIIDAVIVVLGGLGVYQVRQKADD